MDGDELTRRRVRLGRERRRAARPVAGRDGGVIGIDPCSAYELLTRQMVSDLQEELREIRQRVNGLLFVTVGAVLADVVLRLTQ